MPNILILGSGLMSESTIDYLLKSKDNSIVVCSNIEGES